LTAAKGKWKTH